MNKEDERWCREHCEWSMSLGTMTAQAKHLPDCPFFGAVGPVYRSASEVGRFFKTADRTKGVL